MYNMFEKSYYLLWYIQISTHLKITSFQYNDNEILSYTFYIKSTRTEQSTVYRRSIILYT